MESKNILTKDKKEAIALLSIGTFLEYFDLMLYVHMAVVLNDLFFPKTTGPSDVQLLSSFAFCSTYILRPFGALILGYIGDHIGRKATVIITTAMMALTCLAMANLPTYAQIGITASWLITICRVVQGLSSMSEIIGAQLYLTETIKPPARYSVVAMVVVASTFGGLIALLVATIVTHYGANWRLAFLFGTCIALVGFMARLTLRESAEYADAKERVRLAFAASGDKNKEPKNNYLWDEKIKIPALISYFIMESVSPVYFYINYIYCGNLLRFNFGYTAEQVISHNLILGFFNFINAIMLTILCYKFHPLKILRIKLYLFIPFILTFPVFLDRLNSPSELLILQIFSIFLCCTAFPANPSIFIQFPVFKRFTCTTVTFAVSKAAMYAVPAFGLVYITRHFGNLGLLLILIPMNIAYILARNYFEMLEIQADRFHMKKLSIPVFE
jgi:MFS transporter, MHS family, proline/betaine transporter